MVELLFAEVTERCVRRGSEPAVVDVEKAMLKYLDQRNERPKPFVWTAEADLILGKFQRLRCSRLCGRFQGYWERRTKTRLAA